MSCEDCNSLRNEIFVLKRNENYLKKKIEKLENLSKIVNPPKEKCGNCNTLFDEDIRCVSCNRVVCRNCCKHYHRDLNIEYIECGLCICAREAGHTIKYFEK